MRILSAFVHPGHPVYVHPPVLVPSVPRMLTHGGYSAVMYVNLYGNSTAYQTLLMLQDLKLGQYVKLAPRVTFLMQILGTIVGAILNCMPFSVLSLSVYSLPRYRHHDAHHHQREP